MATLHYYNPQSVRRRHLCKNLKANNLNRKLVTNAASATCFICNVQDMVFQYSKLGNTAECVCVLDHMINHCISFVSYNHSYLIYLNTLPSSFLSVQKEEQISSETSARLVTETELFEKLWLVMKFTMYSMNQQYNTKIWKGKIPSLRLKQHQCQNQRLNHAGLPLGASVLLYPCVCMNWPIPQSLKRFSLNLVIQR